MKHHFEVNRIASNDNQAILIDDKLRYILAYNLIDFDDDDLINKRALVGAIPTIVPPFATAIPAGTAMAGYFLPVPSGFNELSRIVWIVTLSADLKQEWPLQGKDLVYSGGDFTGWTLTLTGPDDGLFNTLYDGVLTVV